MSDNTYIKQLREQMYITNTGGEDVNLTEQEIAEAIFERDNSGSGQADIMINDEVVVIEFMMYDSSDSDTTWIILRSNCSKDFLKQLSSL